LLGYYALSDGDYAAAMGYLEENLELCRTIGNRNGEGLSLNGLALAAYARQDYAAALAHAESMSVLVEATGDVPLHMAACIKLAAVYLATGDVPAAARELRVRLGLGLGVASEAAEFLIYVAGLAVAIGRPVAALQIAGCATVRAPVVMRTYFVDRASYAEAARALLPAAEADAAWAAGQTMGDDEIAALAGAVIDAARTTRLTDQRAL
jgi:hypothetical protein